jgi:transglutaminase-like putative cysteine protease
LILVERRTLGWILVGAGAVAATAGVVVVLRSRRGQKALGDGLGRTKAPTPVGTWASDGYTLTHYRKADLPIKERVAILQDLIHKDLEGPNMPKLRKLALQITSKCPARDTRCESKAIYDWMRKNIRYTGDVAPYKLGRNGPVEGVDLFQTGSRTVEYRGGDCDDHTALSCELAILNGIPCKFHVTSPSKDKRRDDYSHILPLHGSPKTSPRQYLAADSTLPGGDKYGIIAPHGKSLQFVA